MTVSHFTIDVGDAGYPARLKATSDAPKRLFCRGAVEETPRSVAIVGARAATASQLRICSDIARELAQQSVAIISGGALGIDAAAHRGALDGGGYTIAVFGTGIDRVYPDRHAELFDAIVGCGGALISSFDLGQPPRPGHFVRRNRIIAGLADLVLVIGAGVRSGALYTANAARDYGRPVAAVPGAPGCARLLAAGADHAETAADVRHILDGVRRRPDVRLPDVSTNTGKILGVLDEKPKNENEIVELTGLRSGVVAAGLVELELEGLAILLPGRNYVRSTLASEIWKG